MTGRQLLFAAFLLQTENCGRFNRKAQQRCHWPASRRLASDPELYLKLKKKKTQQNKQTLVACHGSADVNQKTSALKTCLKEMPWIYERFGLTRSFEMLMCSILCFTSSLDFERDDYMRYKTAADEDLLYSNERRTQKCFPLSVEHGPESHWFSRLLN